MSDEYRRVLHQWAGERVKPYATGEARIASVRVGEFYSGGMISEHTADSPTYTVVIAWADDESDDERMRTEVFPEDIGKLLNELLAIANREGDS